MGRWQIWQAAASHRLRPTAPHGREPPTCDAPERPEKPHLGGRLRAKQTPPSEAAERLLPQPDGAWLSQRQDKLCLGKTNLAIHRYDTVITCLDTTRANPSLCNLRGQAHALLNRILPERFATSLPATKGNWPTLILHDREGDPAAIVEPYKRRAIAVCHDLILHRRRIFR